MTMTTCKECGNDLSTKAESCPKCGAKVARDSLFAKLLLLAVGVGIFGSMVGGGSSPSSTSPQTAPKTNEKSPEEAAKDAAHTRRFLIATVVVQALKSAARDPDSLKIDSLRVSDDAKIACSEYRARNGFGGMNREIIVFVNGKAKSDAATWNKRCTGPMFDYLDAAP